MSKQAKREEVENAVRDLVSSICKGLIGMYDGQYEWEIQQMTAAICDYADDRGGFFSETEEGKGSHV